MKQIVLFFLIMVLFALMNASAQHDSTAATAAEKSSTISALCTAQEEVVKEILIDLYNSNGKIDVVKAYEEKIKPRIADCLEKDMIEAGIKIRNNALEGKFKKIHLTFEKPSDCKFKISAKTKRTYKKAYEKFKKEFPETRKGKTLHEIFSEKEMNKRIDKVAKVMTREFAKNVKKISR